MSPFDMLGPVPDRFLSANGQNRLFGSGFSRGNQSICLASSTAACTDSRWAPAWI
jgi:hypothetical protein